MANVLHSGLTGAELHEPKGADSALVDMVYAADGGGSGSFTHDFQKQIHLAFIKAAGIDESVYLYMPYACTVETIALYGESPGLTALTNSNTITTYNNAGTALTGGSHTAIAGTTTVKTTLSPSANNTFTAGQWIRVRRTVGGAGGAHLDWHVQVILTRTG